ncbi:hypothetical protein D9M69_157550 [compost metagenome]
MRTVKTDGTYPQLKHPLRPWPKKAIQSNGGNDCDPLRLGFAGFSVGASYALTLGITNGDNASHVMAFPGGFMSLFPQLEPGNNGGSVWDSVAKQTSKCNQLGRRRHGVAY